MIRRKSLAVFLAVVVVFAMACNAATVQAYINLAVQIALQVAQLAGLPASSANVVSGDLTQAETLYNSLATADAAAKPGIVTQIDAVLTTAEADMQGIFALGHIASPALQGTIRAALAIGITAIESVRTIMTGSSAPANPVTAVARVALPRGVVPEKARMSPKQLKDLYNSTMAAYPQAKIK